MRAGDGFGRELPPRLLWLSPLPPARTEIARYSSLIVGALAGRFAIETWPEPDGARNHLPLEEFVAGCRADTVPLVHVGNNQDHHALAFAATRQVPSLCLFHDFFLHHLVLGRLMRQHDSWQPYLDEMQVCYGPTGEAAARAVAAGGGELLRERPDELRDFPLIESFGRNCLLAITHNPTLVDDIASRLAAPAVFVPHPYLAGIEARRDRPEDEGPKSLVVFGYLGPNRGLAKIVEALSTYPGRSRFALDLYGPVAEREGFLESVSAQGLAGLVRLHGFVEDAVLDRALVNADLVVNLRTPTMGEASGSALRAFDAGAPSVVTDASWYGSLPDDIVIKAPIGREVETLHATFDRLLAEPGGMRALGDAARRYVRRAHSVEAFGDALAAILRLLPDLRRSWAFREMGHRAVAVGRRAGYPARLLPPALAERLRSLGASVPP